MRAGAGLGDIADAALWRAAAVSTARLLHAADSTERQRFTVAVSTVADAGEVFDR
jgi:hypothetical protein